MDPARGLARSADRPTTPESNDADQAYVVKHAQGGSDFDLDRLVALPLVWARAARQAFVRSARSGEVVQTQARRLIVLVLVLEDLLRTHGHRRSYRTIVPGGFGFSPQKGG